MRKPRCIALATLATSIVAVVVVVVWSTVRFACYTVADPAVVVHPPSVDYFLDSYAAARSAFRAKALAWTRTCNGAWLTEIPVPSKTDGDLAVDVLYLPAQQVKRRLLVLSSGIHGVESFTGSAVQRMFMDEFLSEDLLHRNGVLIIHAMNPYGFKHCRRVTENNVDLNRNCDTDGRLFSTENAGYASLADLLNPQSKAAIRSAAALFFHLKVGAQVLHTSRKVLRQAIGQGQYAFPRGILYGGSDLEPQIRALIPVITKAMGDYPLVMNIDLHTGYGARGQLHLFPNPEKDPKRRAMVEALFTLQKIDWGDGADFYTVR